MKIKTYLQILVPYLMIFFIELAAILLLNDGKFTYTLDDSYIHLSLAENIYQGNYGINSNEFSSPSSSIIWPFLLVPFVSLKFYYLTPLVLNFFITSITIIILYNILYNYILSDYKLFTGFGKHFLVLYFILIFNLVGLIFTGMEHSLQVLLIVTIVSGLFKFIESKKIPFYLILSVIISPLIRYENLAISLSIIIFLFLLQERKLSINLFGLITLPILLFSVYLYFNNREFLPTSIILKSSQFNNIDSIVSPIKNFLKSLKINEGLRLAFILITLLYTIFFQDKRSEYKKLAAITIIAISFHMFFGQYGWFQRYEVYIWIFAVLITLYLNKDFFNSLFKKSIHSFLFLIIASVLFTHHYYYALIATPYAANNIYEQHYFMNKFVTEYYKDNVGVHDIGYVSFNNPYYILDVNGLSNRKVINFRKNNIDPKIWLNKLSDLYNVRLFIIYDKILDVPEDWIKIGKLKLSRPNIIAFDSEVTFYAVNRIETERISKIIAKFTEILPSKVKFIFNTK